MLSRLRGLRRETSTTRIRSSDEKLHNSDEPDLTWQEMTDLSPEDDVAGCGSAYYAAGEQHSTQNA
jgi:hypothetical protein